MYEHGLDHPLSTVVLQKIPMGNNGENLIKSDPGK